LGEQRSSVPDSLCSHSPRISAEELMRQLVPPPEFQHATFDTYSPDPRFNSQEQALKSAKQFATGTTGRIFARVDSAPGVYLDGGFGVGKTHLLASIWHQFKGKKAFGTFLEYTSIVGFLGFQEAVRRLGEFSLICIDEFELDDPGDTMILSRLLKELSAKGVKFAATSNTPPNALGEGRFAAEDFAREIAGLGERFQVLQIDGEDYRHRDPDSHASVLSLKDLNTWISSCQGGFLDGFDELLTHLATLHPTKYRKLLAPVQFLAIQGLYELQDQVPALRFVVFVDRLYELQVPVRGAGSVAITDVFSNSMIQGAYRKKYLRAVSRLGALSEL